MSVIEPTHSITQKTDRGGGGGGLSFRIQISGLHPHTHIYRSDLGKGRRLHQGMNGYSPRGKNS